MRDILFRVGFEGLHATGLHRLARPFLGGVGAILMFHHVRASGADAFQPNRGLEITPAFLEEVIWAVRASGADIVSLDEAHRRLVAGASDRRFVAFTFDDGYRDNLVEALPVMERHEVPFTIYVVPDFADGQGELWWVALEDAIRSNERIAVRLGTAQTTFDTSTIEGRNTAFSTIYRFMRAQPGEQALRRPARELAAAYGPDMASRCRELCMDWAELGRLAAHPLATIGAHTVSHPMLAKLDDAAAVEAEMLQSVERIEARLGVRPLHFAYPVGSADAAGPREFEAASRVGFRTAITTRTGVLFPEHAQHLHKLPRLSINGSFQQRRFVDVLLSGAPSALMNRFRRVPA